MFEVLPELEVGDLWHFQPVPTMGGYTLNPDNFKFKLGAETAKMQMLAWLKCSDDRIISAFTFRLSKIDQINLPSEAWENERQVKTPGLWLCLRMKSRAWRCERPTKSISADWGWLVLVKVYFKEQGAAAGLCWTAALLANSALLTAFHNVLWGGRE